MGDVRTFITSRRNMGYWRRGRHLIFDIFRNSFTDIIIANSYAVREKSIIDEKLPPPQVIVIYNGIDLSRYGDMTTSAERAAARRELGIDDREKVIGMISNIKNIKGYDYFLGAAKLIKNKGYAAKFVIAGDGSDEPAFQDSVRRHGLGGSLLLLGLCKDVSKAFGVMDIFMYSSLSEGFPNIILEAMAAGKAIVATDVGGTSEMLQDGYSGLLVPPRHSDALAEAAISLLDDERMACRLAEAARNSARWYFSMDECVKQYEYIYESMYEKKIKSSKAR
jgi:glycosyltransferase involved in cell wall biosynthesis